MSSSSSIPAAKRRRIDAANQALRKPFRSPMINRAKQESSGSGSPDADATTPGAVGNGSGALPGRRDTYLAETPTKRPSRPPRRRAGPAHRDEDEGDGGVLTRMRTRRREADETVRAAERELETAREAARIEAQSLARRPGGEVDAEMRELVERWRGACRTAAEELLGLIGDRVAGMGGARAWRESRKRQAEPFRDFDGGGVAAGAETGSRMDGDDGDGDGDGGRTEGEEQGEETGDETEFTMHMMLKSLNIEPEVLGYDPVEDRWRE